MLKIKNWDVPAQNFGVHFSLILSTVTRGEQRLERLDNLPKGLRQLSGKVKTWMQVS